MPGLWLLLLIYLTVGCIATLVYVRRSEKAGNSPFVLMDFTPVGILLILMFWPLFVFVMAVELTFPKENDPLKLNKIPQLEKGCHGVVVTKMRPSGKIQFSDRVADAQSISGSLDPGEKVEVVSVEMNLYKVRKSQ